MEAPGKLNEHSQLPEKFLQAGSVKQEPEGAKRPGGDDGATAEGLSVSPDWRELARRIQDETDAHQMLELVQQLVDKLDEEKLRKNLRLDDR
jgi:hypothetical protein